MDNGSATSPGPVGEASKEMTAGANPSEETLFVEDAFVRSNPVAAFAELKAKADDIFGGERSPSLVHRLYERCCFFADIIPARFYARYWKLLLRIVMTFESDLFSNDIANPLATGHLAVGLFYSAFEKIPTTGGVATLFFEYLTRKAALTIPEAERGAILNWNAVASDTLALVGEHLEELVGLVGSQPSSHDLWTTYTEVLTVSHMGEDREEVLLATQLLAARDMTAIESFTTHRKSMWIEGQSITDPLQKEAWLQSFVQTWLIEVDRVNTELITLALAMSPDNENRAQDILLDLGVDPGLFLLVKLLNKLLKLPEWSFEIANTVVTKLVTLLQTLVDRTEILPTGMLRHIKRCRRIIRDDFVVRNEAFTESALRLKSMYKDVRSSAEIPFAVEPEADFVVDNGTGMPEEVEIEEPTEPANVDAPAHNAEPQADDQADGANNNVIDDGDLTQEEPDSHDEDPVQDERENIEVPRDVKRSRDAEANYGIESNNIEDNVDAPSPKRTKAVSEQESTEVPTEEPSSGRIRIPTLSTALGSAIPRDTASPRGRRYQRASFRTPRLKPESLPQFDENYKMDENLLAPLLNQQPNPQPSKSATPATTTAAIMEDSVPSGANDLDNLEQAQKLALMRKKMEMSARQGNQQMQQQRQRMQPASGFVGRGPSVDMMQHQNEPRQQLLQHQHQHRQHQQTLQQSSGRRRPEDHQITLTAVFPALEKSLQNGRVFNIIRPLYNEYQQREPAHQRQRNHLAADQQARQTELRRLHESRMHLLPNIPSRVELTQKKNAKEMFALTAKFEEERKELENSLAAAIHVPSSIQTELQRSNVPMFFATRSPSAKKAQAEVLNAIFQRYRAKLGTSNATLLYPDQPPQGLMPRLQPQFPQQSQIQPNTTPPIHNPVLAGLGLGNMRPQPPPRPVGPNILPTVTLPQQQSPMLQQLLNGPGSGPVNQLLQSLQAQHQAQTLLQQQVMQLLTQQRQPPVMGLPQQHPPLLPNTPQFIQPSQGVSGLNPQFSPQQGPQQVHIHPNQPPPQYLPQSTHPQQWQGPNHGANQGQSYNRGRGRERGYHRGDHGYDHPKRGGHKRY